MIHAISFAYIDDDMEMQALRRENEHLHRELEKAQSGWKREYRDKHAYRRKYERLEKRYKALCSDAKALAEQIGSAIDA